MGFNGDKRWRFSGGGVELGK
jgi:hypothetical protein